jgi:hypothetical protein
MRLFLIFLLPFHWMVAFALLAVAAAGGHLDALFAAIGTVPAESLAANPVGGGISTAFAIGFGLVATLFLWTVLTAAFGADEPGAFEEVAGLAFGCAIALATITLLFSAGRTLGGGHAACAFQIAALAASYVALIAERRASVSATATESEDVRATARFMALGAAHSSMLSRLPGRSGGTSGAV